MSHTYNAVYFRNTNYASAEEAEKGKALRHWEETYGYSSTMDAFTNTIRMMESYDPSAVQEFTFIWTIDDVTFPEMNVDESFDLLDASYDSFKGHEEVLEKGFQNSDW
jgi:hypothetical protein